MMVLLCKNTTMTSQGRTYILRPSLHHHDVMSALNEQRRRGDKKLCDVTLAVERRFLVAHKAVLAACSGYFKERFGEKQLPGNKEEETNQNNSEKRSQKQLNISSRAPMSPPDSPRVKRRRNALSECLPDNGSSSPSSPRAARTPPPQSFHSRLRRKSSNNFTSFNGEIVMLPGLKSKAFLQILDYMYTSELLIHKDNAQDLLFVSCLLQVRPVVDACVKILTKENKWKITRSSYRWAKDTTSTPTSLTTRCDSFQTDRGKALLASPLINSPKLHNRYGLKNSSQESFESHARHEESTNQRGELPEKRASLSPALRRPRGSNADVKKVENQDLSDSCKFLVTAQANDVTINKVDSSQGNNQQLKVFSETDRRDISVKKEECKIKMDKETTRSACNGKNDAKFRRIRTFSDGLYATHDNNGALDLRQKSRKATRNYSDDESQKSQRKPATAEDVVNKYDDVIVSKNPSVNDSLVSRSMSGESKQRTEDLTQHSIIPPVNGNNIPHPDNSATKDLDMRLRDLSSLDLPVPQPHKLPPSQPLYPLHATINPRLSFNDFPLNPQQIADANEALKRVGLLTNGTVPSFIPSFPWKDTSKLTPLDRPAFLREQPIRSFDAHQVRSWLGCFEPYSVFNPASQLPSPYSNCQMKMSVSNEFGMKIPSMHQLVSNGTATAPGSLYAHEVEKRSSPQNQSLLCESNKHPLKRKLMLSAAMSGTESFGANLTDGEPPPKSSPKSVAATISRFEPLRGPETAVTKRQQQCVM